MSTRSPAVGDFDGHPFGDRSCTITMPLRAALALGGLLRVADTDALEDMGLVPQIDEPLGVVFGMLDGFLTAELGDDWPNSTITPEQADAEDEEEAAGGV